MSSELSPNPDMRPACRCCKPDTSVLIRLQCALVKPLQPLEPQPSEFQDFIVEPSLNELLWLSIPSLNSIGALALLAGDWPSTGSNYMSLFIIQLMQGVLGFVWYSLHLFDVAQITQSEQLVYFYGTAALETMSFLLPLFFTDQEWDSYNTFDAV